MSVKLPKLLFVIAVGFIYLLVATPKITQAMVNNFCYTKTAYWKDTFDVLPPGNNYYGGFCDNDTFNPWCESGSGWKFWFPSCDKIVFDCSQLEWENGQCPSSGTANCTWQQQNCPTGDSCTAPQPYLNPGQCRPSDWDNIPDHANQACQISSTVYKTCCNSNGTLGGICTGGDFSGSCPTGTTTVFCGFGGYAACGAAACQTLAPPPPPVCTPNGSCNAPTPACGTTTSGVDNCGNPCTKQGQACTPAVCDPFSQGPVCNGGRCTDGSVCSQGHQYCLADGSGYGSCSIEVDNCASQCSTAPPPPPPVQVCDPFSQGPVCNGSQCTDGTVCAQGHQYCLWDGSGYGECSIEVDNCTGQCSGSTLPPPCGDNVCSSDETCTTCSQDCGACPSTPPPPEETKDIPNLVCKESVSVDGGNTWSNSVFAQPGQQVNFKMEITNLGNPIDWLAVRNDFDETVDGFLNLWQNTVPDVFYLIYANQPDELGFPGIYWDSHYEDSGGFGVGAIDRTSWSATLNDSAKTFKNGGYGVYGGYARPSQLNGNFNDRCWQNPDSGGTTCLQIVPAPDGGRCNPAWEWCPYNMYAFCNKVTVSTNTVPLPNLTLNNSCTPVGSNDLLTISWNSSAPAVSWVNISTNLNFQGYYHKSVSGTTQTNASSGFNGNPSSGVSGALEFQPGQRYYVRLWNGVNHSDTVEFTAPGVCSPKGSLDSVNCTSFTGWTCDADNYLNPLQVDFWTQDATGNNVYIGWARANERREAAVANQCGGNPNHGYTFTVPGALKDGQNHQIFAYGLNLTSTPGQHTLLTGSPKSLQCAAGSGSNDTSGPGTSCNGNVPYTGNEGSYALWNNACSGRVQQQSSGGIGQSCCELACGADAGCDEQFPGQGNCNSQCGVIAPAVNTPWIQTTGGDVHSNTGINTPGGP